jgi:cell division protein FtsA
MVLSKLKTVITKNQNQPEHIVALDKGTEYVKDLLGKVVPTEAGRQKIEVIGVGRQHQRLSDMYSGAIADIGGVVENCDVALSQAEDMAGVTAKDTVIGIAGELVKGNTTTLRYKRANPNKSLENNELRNIIDQVQSRALERAKAQLAWESATSEVEIKLVNAAIVNVSIDGYKVTNPLGFQGKDVSIQLFTAFAPMVHISAIERVAYDLDLNLINVSA